MRNAALSVIKLNKRYPTWLSETVGGRGKADTETYPVDISPAERAPHGWQPPGLIGVTGLRSAAGRRRAYKDVLGVSQKDVSGGFALIGNRARGASSAKQIDVDVPVFFAKATGDNAIKTRVVVSHDRHSSLRRLVFGIAVHPCAYSGESDALNVMP